LKIVVDCKSGLLIKGQADFIIQSSIPGIVFRMFGKPILFKSNQFISRDLDCRFESIAEIIPYISGDYLLIEQKNEKITSFAVDFYGHSRYYYYLDKAGLLEITTSVGELNTNSEDLHYDYYQILLFLLKGYTWKGGTFFTNLKIVTPTMLHVIENVSITLKTVKLPKIVQSKSLDAIVGDVLKGIAKSDPNNKVNLMYSGGKDSTFIALILNEKKIDFSAMFSRYSSPTLSLNLQDSFLSSTIATSQGFEYKELNCDAKSDLKENILDTIKLLPFDFHISVAQRNIIKSVASTQSRVILSGQNADSFYNMGFTGTYPFYKAAIKRFLGILKPEEYENLVNRYFQTDKVLSRLKRNSNSWLENYLWSKFNKKEKLTLKKLLSVLTFNGTCIPKFEWNKMEALTTKFGRNEVYVRNLEEIENLLSELENGRIRNVRELLLRMKLLGHCQGRDVRCITEWSREFNLSNIQIYSTAPVFMKLLNLKNTIKDINQPKFHIFQFVKRRVNYDRIDKLVQKQIFKDVETTNERELFTFLESGLDIETLNQGIKTAFEVLNKSDLFDIEAIRNLAAGDKVFSLQLFWLGRSIQNFKN
jgi:hypothetical protein